MNRIQMMATAVIASQLEAVRERIERACKRAHRDPSSVCLVLASKTQPPEVVAAAYAAGARDFGENYVQEARAKWIALANLSNVRRHMIGHLQTNKARVAAENFDLIHTVDGRPLATALARAHPAPPLPVLIEVKLGGEPSKHGVSPGATPALIESVRAIVDVRGLMTIPPRAENPAAAHRWFAELRELRDRLEAESGLRLNELSMGMSEDYTAAIEEGATIVRVGRAVFGARPR
jgi:pyridoxal phosphate enzyme (YggS family)